MTPGYSGTPLSKKLGIGTGQRLLVLDCPEPYAAIVAAIPEDVTLATRPSSTVDLVHLFATERRALQQRLEKLRTALRPDAVIWVSWPKKASKVPTDITEDTIRAVALPLGLVDVKVCAVTDVWSGLKLVVRKELR